MDNQANLTIGYIPTTAIRNKFLTSSYIYYTSNLVWITSPGRLFTSLEKLFQPFGKFTWSCVLMIFVFGFIAIRIVKLQTEFVQNFVLGKRNSSPCLNILNIFFGGSLHKLPIKTFARTLLAMFMLYCLVIRSSYTGKVLLTKIHNESNLIPRRSLQFYAR